MKNEFKFSSMRNFGSEQFSFTVVVHSDDSTLSKEEIAAQTKQLGTAINEMFLNTMERELTEKATIAAQSVKREEANKSLKTQMDNEIESAKKLHVSGDKLSKVVDKQK